MCCRTGATPKRLPVIASRGHKAETIGHEVSKAAPGRILTWDRTPLGLETAAPNRPRAALAVKGSEKTLNF